jgi:polygalacturonase/sugar lactone lactonase YvrE
MYVLSLRSLSFRGISLHSAAALLFALLFLSSLPALAQDTRSVSEPTIPGSCTVLAAQLTTVNGDLPSASENSFDTTRIQTAINNCPAGQAVELATGPSGANAYLIQPITIATGVTLLVDAGVTVYASRNPRDYDVSSGSCGIVAASSAGCNPVISSRSSNTAIMGFGTINGRGGDTLIGPNAPVNTSWWQLATNAQSQGLNQFNPTLINFSNASNITLYKITLINSPIFHVVAKNVNGFTVWGIKISTPYTSRNTDGLDVDQTSNVTIENSYISDGDDNVAVGASGTPSNNLSILNNHFYSGHGMSIGSFTSGGISNMLVDHTMLAGNSSDGNAIGIRIKSADDRGGTVQNVTYQNMCIENTASLLQFNPLYNTNSGTEIPNYQSIFMNNIHFLTEGSVELDGASSALPLGLTLNNVVFDSLKATDLKPAPQFANITLGPGPVSSNLTTNLTGTGVTVTNNITNPSESPFSCTGVFVFLAGELITSTSSITAGQPVNLTAIVQPAVSGAATATGTVQISDNGNPVATVPLSGTSNLLSIAITGATAGSHTYTANYSGDGNYAPLSFGSVPVTVNPATGAASTTTLSGVPSNSTYGSTFQVTASVTGAGTTPSGSVEFLLGNALLATVPLTSGSASFTVSGISAGAYSLSAAYSGDSNYAGSTSSASSLTVAPASTSTSLQSSATQITAGNTATLTATIGSAAGTPPGSVAFFDSSTQIGTAALSSGSAVINAGLAVGTHSITASYVATQNFAASTSSPAITITVTPSAAATFSVLPEPLPVTISTIAGGAAANCGGSNAAGDGCQATQVNLGTTNDLRGVSIDAFNNVYFTDSNNSRIRLYNPTTGILSSFAGAGSGCSGQADTYGDGCPVANSKSLGHPRGVWVDSSNNVFFAGFTEHLIHEVQASTGVMIRVAGALSGSSGTSGLGADGIAATSSALNAPRGVWTDLNGNIYIADTGNNRVRVVYTAGTIPNVTTPTVGDVYTLAGTGTAGSSGDKAIASSALLSGPQGGVTDANGNVFIADSANNKIRVIYTTGSVVANLIIAQNPGVTPTAGFIYTIAGGGSTGASATPTKATSVKISPQKLVMDPGGNIYISDGQTPSTASFLDIRTGYLRALAIGAGTGCGTSTDAVGDGCPGIDATFGIGTGGGIGVALDRAGNLYLTDSADGRVRKVSTNAAFASSAVAAAVSQSMKIHFIAGDTPASSTPYAVPSGFEDFSLGSASCTLNADTTTDCSLPVQFDALAPGERVSPLTVTSTAGSIAYLGLTGIGLGAGGAVDPAVQTSIGASLTPQGVAVDSQGNVYVSDSSSSSVKKYAPGSGTPSTLGAGFTSPRGVAVDLQGNVFIAAGSAVQRIGRDGSIANVGSGWVTPTGIATDSLGNIYVADPGLAKVVVVGPALTVSTTIGGTFTAPSSVAVDAAFNLYVADPAAGKVTKVTPAHVSSTVTTGASAPSSVAVDAADNLYVADSSSLQVFLVPAGGGSPIAIDANLQTPRAVAIDGVGNVYVADSSLQSIVELERSMGALAFLNGSTSLNATLSSIGNQAITPSGAGFTATDSTDFTINASASGACNFGASIAAGTACTLNAQFTPHQVGILTDTLTFSGNYANLAMASPQALELKLTGHASASLSGQVNLVKGGLSYNSVKHIGSQTVTITNTSGAAITGPIQLVLSGLPGTVTPANNAGLYQNNPYWTATGSTLNAGASVQITVQFSYAAGTNFSATAAAYSGVF